jgi:hypothetical protein
MGAGASTIYYQFRIIIIVITTIYIIYIFIPAIVMIIKYCFSF